MNKGPLSCVLYGPRFTSQRLSGTYKMSVSGMRVRRLAKIVRVFHIMMLPTRCGNSGVISGSLAKTTPENGIV